MLDRINAIEAACRNSLALEIACSAAFAALFIAFFI